MDIPRFITEEGVKPVGSYEWSLWALINGTGLLCLLVALPFLVFIALVMTLVDIVTA